MALAKSTSTLLTFPASRPYVISIGGTMHDSPEVATDSIWRRLLDDSNQFEHPSYQSRTVSEFLKILGSEYEGLHKLPRTASPTSLHNTIVLQLYVDLQWADEISAGLGKELKQHGGFCKHDLTA
ncbi:hypothetical protein EI94DRAFT_1828908 [Lactarius quietus]|nr:hypothetical protein EI94DRAFT_1828908 [Lactarius quietus]